MADTDETQFPGAPSIPELSEPLPEGNYLESPIVPDPGPTEDEILNARSVYKESVIRDLKSSNDNQGIPYTDEQIKSEAEEIMGFAQFGPGKSPGLFRRAISTTDRDPYKTHEALALENQGKSNFLRIPYIFEAPDPSAQMTAEQAREQGFETQAGERVSSLTPEEQKALSEGQETFIVGSAVGGATIGGVVGLAAGGPVGAAAGVLVGGLSGLGLSALGSSGYGAYRDLSGSMDKTDTAMDAARSLHNFFQVDLIDDMMVDLSDEGRELVVAKSLMIADYIGLKELPDFLDRYGIIDAESLRKNLRDSVEDIEKSRSIRSIPESVDALLGPALPNELVMDATPVFKELQQGTIKSGLNFYDGFIDLTSRIFHDEKYREMRSKIRNDRLTLKKIESNLERRNTYPNSADQVGLLIYANIKDQPSLEPTKESAVSGWLNSLSYAEIHPALQKKKPNVSKFIEIAKTIDLNSPIMRDEITRLPAAIEAVHLKKSKKDIQSILNQVQIDAFNHPYFEDMPRDFIPSIDQVDSWANKAINKKGAKFTRAFVREMNDLVTDRTNNPEYGVLYSENTLGAILRHSGLLISGLAEVKGSVFTPFGYVTPAGLDEWMDLGIRDLNADWVTRYTARHRSGTGGFQEGYREVLLALGFDQSTWQYAAADKFGFGLDMLDLEKYGFTGARKGVRLTRNAFRAVPEYRSADSGYKYNLAKQVLLDGVVDSGSVDPSVRYHQTVLQMLQDRQSRGIDVMDDITQAERELVRRILLNTGRQPDLYEAASAQASGNLRKAKMAGQAIVRQIDTSDALVFRNSIEYRSFANQIQKLVDDGIIDPSAKDVFLAMIENQAHVIAEQSDSAFNSPIEVLRSIDLSIDRSPTGSPDSIVRTQVDSGNGNIRGFYEYNSGTGESVMNMFRNADMDTLWQSNGSMIASLMGSEWRQKLFGSFEHTVDPNGLRVLTDAGEKQFADAWMYYNRTRDNSNGFVRRMFDSLFVQLHSLWNRLRKRPDVVPKEVRTFWDLHFGELPKDRRFVTKMTERMTRIRPMTIVVDRDIRTRIIRSEPAAVSREMVAKEPSMNPEVLHQYLGDKLEIIVERVIDADGSPVDTPRRVYGETTDDALEVVRKAIAYVKTQNFRQSLKEPTVAVGSNRFIVPKSQYAGVLERVKRRLIDALGHTPETISSRIFQRDFTKSPDGSTSITNRADLPDYVTNDDLNDFATRIILRYGGTTRAAIDRISTTEFIVLTDREIAGIKTLIQELAVEPVADLLPTSLLDPNSNLRLISVVEYDEILTTLQDVEAGPLSRRNRNLRDPGIIERLTSLSKILVTKPIGDRIQNLFNKFQSEVSALNKKNADPVFAGLFDEFKREASAQIKSLIKQIESFDEPDGHFADFYQHTVRFFVPIVPVHKVRKLFFIMKELDGLKDYMDDDARAAVRRSNLRGTDLPEGLDPITAEGGTLGLKSVFNMLSDIQEILNGLRGMTRVERQAIIKLRELSLKSQLSEMDRFAAADCIQVLHAGLKGKFQSVSDVAHEILSIVSGSPYDDRVWGMSRYDDNLIEVYKSYYAGTNKGMRSILDIVASRGKIAANPSFNKSLLGRVKSQDVDLVRAFTNVLIYSKMADIRTGLARRLAEAGYDLSRRGLIDKLKTSSTKSTDYDLYIERVTYYINEELGFLNKRIIRKGKGIEFEPQRVGGELLGPLERKPEIRKLLDKEAQAEAARILDQMGLRQEKGQLTKIMLGDREFILPSGIVEEITKLFNDSFDTDFNVSEKMGPDGRLETRLLGDTTPATVEALSNVFDAFRLGFEASPLNARSWYKNLLVGPAGFPMVPYMFGVFFGTLSQVHLGQGPKAAMSDIAMFAPTATEAMGVTRKGKPNTAEMSFVGGILARMWGSGGNMPITKPRVFPDGRILTADMVLNAVDKYGLKQSFVDHLKNKSIHDRVIEQFTTANQWTGGSIIGGVIGTAFAGPAGAVTGAALGGVTTRFLLKRGGVFDKLDRFYTEISTAIDSYFRIRVLVREIEAGRTMEDAVRTARDIVLDYSDLSKYEQTHIKAFFAFYVYFRQAGKMYMKSVVDNPSRIVSQIKLIQGAKRTVTDTKDPDRRISEWDQPRLMIPMQFGNFAIRSPMQISGDMLTIVAEIVDLLAFDGDDSRRAAMALSRRVSPASQEAFKQIFGIDPGRGFDIDRATNQVPALLVQLDHDILGGVLHELLGIEYVSLDDIRETYDEKTARKINLRNLEMPGRGIYRAKNAKMYSFIIKHTQMIGLGRTLQLFEAIDRSNIGITEALVAAADAYYRADKERPLLARVPGLVEMGLVNAKRSGISSGGQVIDMVRPTSIPGTSTTDTATARPSMRKYYSYVGSDGDKYELRYDDFYPLELLRLIGFSAVPMKDVEEGDRRQSKRHISELEAKTQ